MRPQRAEALLFVLALSMLAFEMAQIRAFSYALDPRLVYGAIGLAMLGMGAAAVFAAIKPSLLEPARVPAYTVGFGVSVLCSMAIFARTSTSFDAGSFGGLLVTAAPLLFLCAVPYALGGLAMVSLQTRTESLHRRYVANLFGSSMGCFVVQPLLPSVGLERLILLVAALPMAAALFLTDDEVRTPRLRLVAFTSLALAFALGFVAPRVLPFEPDPRDLYAMAERAAKQKGLAPEPGAPAGKIARRELAVWDPIARVEVFQFPGELSTLNGQSPLKILLHDGGAGSLLFGGLDQHPLMKRALFEGTTYGTAYAVSEHPDRVLAIGLGGAPDIMAAKYFGAKSITGVEVNGATLEAIRTRFAPFLGDPYAGVTLHHLDGRSFAESATGPYDIVQISGTDTYSAGNAGAFMFSESYLYTEEAIRAFMKILAPDGILAMIRFGPEPLRLVATEVAAARSLGITDPAQHFVVLGQGGCQSVVFSKQPITNAQLRRVATRLYDARSLPRLSAPLNTALGLGPPELPQLSLVYAPGVNGTDPIFHYLKAVTAGTEQQFIARLGYDYSPVSDDRPFFFQFLGVKQLGQLYALPADDFFAKGLRGHLLLLATLAALSALLLFAPIFVARRSLPEKGVVSTIAYFGALGVGFMLVELALMQRTALVLGHPTWSVSTTIFALLASSALGSALAGRSQKSDDTIIGIAAVALALYLLLVAFVPGGFVAFLLRIPFALRVVLLAIVVAPLGVAMGAFFPTGLRAVRKRGEPLVALAQGVNAFASVIASMAAPLLAMIVGFRMVMLVALVIYALGAVVARTLAPHEAKA